MEKGKWFKDYINVNTDEFQRLNDSTYIQRRNFEQIDEEQYVCDARLITLDEYNEIMERRDEIKKVVLETTNTAAYEDGYKAAMILLGGEE